MVGVRCSLGGRSDVVLRVHFGLSSRLMREGGWA